MFARGEERRVELAIRAALGAGPGRLLGNCSSEPLSSVDSARLAGLLLAGWLVRAFLALNAAALPRSEADRHGRIRPRLPLGLALLTPPLLFGILPALQASRPDLRENDLGRRRAGQAPSRTDTGRPRHDRVAVALVLLVARRCSSAASGT